MGAWGSGIRQDDFVCDVIGDFEDLLKEGKSVPDASRAVKSKFVAEIEDTDDGPLFWIALADVQWTYGEVERQVLKRVNDDFDSGRSLIPWAEDQGVLSRRRTALKKFLTKIAMPNPRPKKLPKLVVRAPKFQSGVCLSIQLSNSQFGAAIVLAADHSNVEHGVNLVGVLDYMSPEKPTMEVFLERQWLVRTHHNWNNVMDLAWYPNVGFRKAKDRLETVGHVELLDTDPRNSNTYAGWDGIGEQVLYQREWNAIGT
jgi:hypothetical protein